MTEIETNMETNEAAAESGVANDDNVIHLPNRSTEIVPVSEEDEATSVAPVSDDTEDEQEEGEDEPTNIEDDDAVDELDEAAAQIVEDYRKRTLPCADPVEGERLFDDLSATISRFIVMPEGAADVAALWVVMTYTLHAANLRFAPRLMVTAPGPNSGKTTMLELLTYLSRYPEPSSDITAASFFRLAKAKKTMLLDECDHSLPNRHTTRNELVACINMGHKGTTAVVEKVEMIAGERIVVRHNIFGPCAMAGIGEFGPPTTRSRAFIIKLKPKLAHEEVEQFHPDQHAPAMRALREQIARWVLDNKAAIRECRPDLDRDLMNNRARDNAVTLLQIADVMGGEVAARARTAIKALTRGDVMDANALLLGDIASILTDNQVRITHKGYVFTGDLCNMVMERFPDREAYQGFNQARLATMLRHFDIEPEQRRRDKQVLRAYHRPAFDEWFHRYGFADAADAADVVDADIDRSDVAPEVEDAAPPLPPKPPVEAAAPSVAATPLHQLFPKAHHEKPSKGDKKRAAKLCELVGGCVQTGKIDASRVRFTSALFWIVEADDGKPLWAHLNVGELDLLPIEAPGLVADNDAGIIINATKTLCMAESDYRRYRSLVNKARKALNV